MLQSARDQLAEFWTANIDEAGKCGVEEAILPHMRRTPRGPRLIEEGSEGHVFLTPESYYTSSAVGLLSTD